MTELPRALRIASTQYMDEGRLVDEWDAIAFERDRQLRGGVDRSFDEVLCPWVLAQLHDAESIIDVGCGTGVLTERISTDRARVVGIDPSAKSIEIARKHNPRGLYHVASLSQWVEGNPGARFDLAVANMVLMDVLDVPAFLRGLRSVTAGGRVAMTFTHPMFWPDYWGYRTEDGFDYLAELAIESPFRTAAQDLEHRTTHFHRPLSWYVSAIARAGLVISDMHELRGPESMQAFAYPRFVAISATVPTESVS